MSGWISGMNGVEDLDALKRLLGENEQAKTWLEGLDRIGGPDFDVALPASNELPPVLLELAVPHEDIDALVTLRPSRDQSPAIWWLLERCAHSLVRDLGAIRGPLPFPALPEDSGGLGALHRYFYVYVFLAALPHVRAFHRARAIPDEISRLTLADLGRNMAVHRRRHGQGGLAEPHWLMLHFRGTLYALGRLQFQRARLGGRTGRAVAAAGLPYGPGDPALAVHVPAYYGPLTPAACDESFAQASTFFARHFPEEQYAVATCHSWLLDEQLGEYLSENANIIHFQRRFRPAYRPDDDATTLRFVFGRTTPALDQLDALPCRTTLERATTNHIKRGRHWHGGAGWLRL